MLRTRLVTAAVALPALWLIVWKLPLYLFAGFIMAVAAMALFEYFTRCSMPMICRVPSTVSGSRSWACSTSASSRRTSCC